MTSSQIEKNVNSLVKNLNRNEFIYELLLSYGISKTSITRLKKGDFNLAKNAGEVLYKKKVFFKEVNSDQLLHQIDEISKHEAILNHDPRFVIVTDYSELLAKDIKTGQSLDIDINKLHKHFDFFLPWAGQEKYLHKNENLADRKASYEMAKLYDILVHENPHIYEDGGHNLNIFLSRLLFCFFAEDTDIFQEEGVFTTTLAKHTEESGNDVHLFLDRLFDRLNSQDARKFPDFFQKFPFVNGGLFKDDIRSPKFSKKARQIILECGELNWSEINPDIFGSMIQAVVNPEYRSGLGMHYTSVPNIMKVIEPLFLNELNDEFEKYKDRPNMLRRLINRISKIKVFDPACGSGNFLIIAYKELRRLEIQILARLNEIEPQQSIVFTEIKLSQFYGIEVDDFAHEMAILSLWLAEHQMNKVFEEDLYDFGKSRPILPLKEAGHITSGNALRVDWENVCPAEGNEVYILGNPPYLGTRNQNSKQKKEVKQVFSNIRKNGKIDYIGCWFYLASEYIRDKNASYAFVSTNSICQGEQVSILWPHILQDDLEICFAYPSFKWSNNAKGGAGVTVVIIGISQCERKERLIFEGNIAKTVKHINPYLTNAPTIYIQSRSKPISSLPGMMRGNYTGCCNDLILTYREKEIMLKSDSRSANFIKPLIGSSEFINSNPRFCLWIDDNDLDAAKEIDQIREKINKVRIARTESSDKGQNDLVDRSHQFREFYATTTQSILIPVVSSERREYIPCGFIEVGQIVPNSAQIIYDCETWIFGLISSKMHLAWVKSIAGRLENRIRYSSSICYNTFPFPKIDLKNKEQITLHVYSIMDAREKFPEKTIAELYDPDKMPIELKHAHNELDSAIERCYRLKPFESDTERLEYLFKEYEKLTS